LIIRGGDGVAEAVRRDRDRPALVVAKIERSHPGTEAHDQRAVGIGAAAIWVLPLARQQARLAARKPPAHRQLLAANRLGECGRDRQVALAGELVVEVAQIGGAGRVEREGIERQRARVDRSQPRLDQDLDERARGLVGQHLERLLALEAGDHAVIDEARQALRPAAELARVVRRARR
jgi:hypothetical protein